MTKPVLIPITEDRYPSAPQCNPDELLNLYAELRNDAQRLSRSRGYYAGRVVSLRHELAEFAGAAQITLQEKAQLNALVARYADTFQAFEQAGDELIGGLTDYDTGMRDYRGGNPIHRLIVAVRAFAKAWKAAKDLGAEIEDTNNGIL